ncbi:hypothetical protein B0H10DRAFT_1939285 [Mycena sp. CBHHK59/15]|nr:hypothetical protein B0H10DRAFT_1939285 [Mycena sp. CBHHK59/15]
MTLNARVADLERQLALAKLDGQIADTIILSQEFLISSFRKFPVELLAKVFHMVIESTDHWDRYACTWTLVHICSGWSFVIQNDSSFWKDLDFRCTPWNMGANGLGGPKATGLRRMDVLSDFLSKSSRALNITMSLTDPLDAQVMVRLVEERDHWERLSLSSFEVCNGPEHPSFSAMKSLQGNLPHLQHLELRSFAQDGSWGAHHWFDSVQDVLTVTWFNSTPKLISVYLYAVFEPENTVILPWTQIQTYTEISSRRTGEQEQCPSSHLRQMTSLVSLTLNYVWIPDAGMGLLLLPNLTKLSLTYPEPYLPHLHLKNYDRLEALVLPNLQNLKVDGGDFGKQSYNNDVMHPQIHVCVQNMLARANPEKTAWRLVSLSIALNTGLTDSGTIILLCCIPSLRHFKVTQGVNDDHYSGILTTKFLCKFRRTSLTLETLTIQGSNGYKSKLLDLRTSSVHDGFCPIPSNLHIELDKFIGDLKGDKLLIHRSHAHHTPPTYWSVPETSGEGEEEYNWEIESEVSHNSDDNNLDNDSSETSDTEASSGSSGDEEESQQCTSASNLYIRRSCI